MGGWDVCAKATTNRLNLKNTDPDRSCYFCVCTLRLSWRTRIIMKEKRIPTLEEIDQIVW